MSWKLMNILFFQIYFNYTKNAFSLKKTSTIRKLDAYSILCRNDFYFMYEFMNIKFGNPTLTQKQKAQHLVFFKFSN